MSGSSSRQLIRRRAIQRRRRSSNAGSAAACNGTKSSSSCRPARSKKTAEKGHDLWVDKDEEGRQEIGVSYRAMPVKRAGAGGDEKDEASEELLKQRTDDKQSDESDEGQKPDELEEMEPGAAGALLQPPLSSSASSPSSPVSGAAPSSKSQAQLPGAKRKPKPIQQPSTDATAVPPAQRAGEGAHKVSHTVRTPATPTACYTAAAHLHPHPSSAAHSVRPPTVACSAPPALHTLPLLHVRLHGMPALAGCCAPSTAPAAEPSLALSLPASCCSCDVMSFAVLRCAVVRCAACACVPHVLSSPSPCRSAQRRRRARASLLVAQAAHQRLPCQHRLQTDTLREGRRRWSRRGRRG